MIIWSLTVTGIGSGSGSSSSSSSSSSRSSGIGIPRSENVVKIAGTMVNCHLVSRDFSILTGYVIIGAETQSHVYTFLREEWRSGYNLKNKLKILGQANSPLLSCAPVYG